MADPDRPCPHENFDAYVEVNRVTASDDDPTVVGYHADIKVNCADCDEPFRWTGVRAGSSPREPMCSVDETELRAPLRPASADPDFGLGLPGFAVNYRGHDERPRCPECRMPHDLTPGSLGMVACKFGREQAARVAAERAEGEPYETCRCTGTQAGLELCARCPGRTKEA